MNMDEYSPPIVERKKKGKKQGHSAVVDDEDGDHPIKCSGKSCRSCSGGLIADCVAVCCCPCAVVNILALAFLKIPWMVGRKCLRRLKNKKLEDKKRKQYDKSTSVEEGIVMTCSFGEEELKHSTTFCEKNIDVEQVWLDLYQLGHMGFGRLSFTATN